LALSALQAVRRGAYADAAVHQALQHSALSDLDRRLFTELVYGCVRRQRTLESLVAQFVPKSPPVLLGLILQVGLYQLRYLTQIPDAAAVHSTVDLAKTNGFGGLAGLVNGVLRRYLRAQAEGGDPLQLPAGAIARLGTLHSFPDWIVEEWVSQFGLDETAALCDWMNQSPRIDLRVNRLVASVEQVEAAFAAAGVTVQPVAGVPYALRIVGHAGAVQALPGFHEGWWTVQDSSAQLVGALLDPQPGETVIDACAAPGGKTTHLAELMGDRGTIWACDRTANRLKKLAESIQRLRLTSIQPRVADSRQIPDFVGMGDRVLLDVPCSGLGTLHRHADARWRQTPASVAELTQLQQELLDQAITWVKPGGTLVYATCTLHPAENEGIILPFLEAHPNWQIDVPLPTSPLAPFLQPEGWVKVLPHHQEMDGFFMVRLRHQP